MFFNMCATKPRFRFVCFALIILLLLSSNVRAMAAESEDDDDLDAWEELLAAEEEEEQGGFQAKSTEAEAMSRAQRIVLELNNENAKRVIESYEFVLVLGYAPWSARCAELMPQFAEAATALREMGSPLLMAKLDADRYPKAASVLGIKGFPSLILFVNGSDQLYTGGFTGEEMVIWARKKTGVPIIRLSSVPAAEEFLRKHQMFIIGLFDNFEAPYYEEFVKAAVADNEVQFVETSDIEVAKILFPDIKQKTRFIGLVKSEPERFETFEEEFGKDKILQFLELNKFPLVTMMTELNSVKVYSSPLKLQVFIFAEDDDFKKLFVPLQDVARKFKSKIMFVYVNSNEDDLAKPILTIFGLESEKPVATAFDYRIGSKYLLESDLTTSKLEVFCSELLNGTLSPYFKSEPIPDTGLQKGIVRTVVSKTFDAIVLSSSENVLLEVYTPWCIDCEAMTKQTENLAKHFQGHSGLIFARIDASLNEHPRLQINDYPALLFYPSGDKANPVFIFAEDDDFKKLFVPLQDVARKFKSKIMFVYVNSNEDDLAKPILTIFGLESEKPVATAFDYRIGSKYLLESDLTTSKLEVFCSELLNGTLSPYFKSEPIPDTGLQKGIVRSVVSKTFDAIVLSSSENVLLEVYTPWCIDCEAMTKQTENLAKHFQGHSGLIFARIDASLNEHPRLQINDYPALLFYPSGDKANPITLPKKSSLKDMIAFVNRNVKAEGKNETPRFEKTMRDEL